VSVLASGAPGFGRDASVAFAAGSAGATMLVSFLDLQGKDTPAAMVARLAVFGRSAVFQRDRDSD
jgi:hypothetical protein